MKKILYILFFCLTLYGLFLSITIVRKGEVHFFNDVARDFLLLQELDQKKIVLIGPRSSTSGLFNGPFWTYLNYPAYLVGNGNPVVVEWFWILLEITMIITCFLMAKKMFNILAAIAYVSFLPLFLIPHIDGIMHAEAIYFFTPAFFFFIAMYIKSKKIIFLISHLAFSAIITQLNIALGISLFGLSLFYLLWFMIKNKLWKHLYSFLLMPVLLSNFIIFDIRHQYRMIKAILSTGTSTHFFITLQSWLENRINNTVSLQLFNNANNDIFAYIVFISVIIGTVFLIKNKNKHRIFYVLFLYYYLGYIVLSVFNKGILLVHYVYLLIPLTTLWLASFLATKYKVLFFPLICIVLFIAFNFANNHIKARESTIGKHFDSWIALTNIAKEITDKQKDKEFGYYVYTPDSFAYQPRYAMIYNFKAAHARAYEYIKKSTTYVIAAPPPSNNPYMGYQWWIEVPVRISAKSVETKKFPSGFTIEKFNLSPEEQLIPHDKSIELGIHFR